MNYFDKYLKYKAKYLNLLNDIITGGMSKRSIQTGEYDAFLFTYYNVDNWDSLLINIKNDNNITNIQKINLLENELGDIEHSLNDEDNTDETNKALGRKILDIIKNELETYYKIDSMEIDLILLNATTKKSNSYFDTINDKAKDNKTLGTDEIRGDINEEDITEKQSIKLSIIDNDNSIGYNTKNFKAYNNNFFETLKTAFTVNGKEPQNEMFVEQILKFVPVDIIKDNTIWEIKSLNDSDKNSNSIKNTKLKGFENKNISIGGIFIGGTIRFSFEFTSDGKKVKNIIFELIGKKQIGYNKKPIYDPNGINIKMPILKENPNGYDYYWYMSNSSGDRYYSPLTDQSEINNFINELKELDIDITKIINDDDLENKLRNKNISTNKNDTLLHKYTYYNENSYNFKYLSTITYNNKTYYLIPKKFSIKLPPSYTDGYSEIFKKDEFLNEYGTLFNLRTNNNYYI